MSRLLLDPQHQRVCLLAILCSDFALHRYASMRQVVEHMVFRRHGPMSYKPTSSSDWSYCAFNEQLQRIAGQLAATIEGIDVGTLVCMMFHIILQVSSTAIST